jgi:hypothetical protein
MLTRRQAMLAVGCGLFGASAARAQESWTRYVNPRFGTHVDYMEFFEPDDPPENGDGQSFHSPEATFSVFAHYNVLDETPQSQLSDALNDPQYADLAYKAIKGGRLTLSGHRGAMIYYESYLYSGGSGVVHGLVIEYPAAYKRDYDAMVTRMAKSFGGP